MALAVWLAGLVLRFVILFRGLQSKTLGRFPFFYAYALSALAGDLFVYATWTTKQGAYQESYWAAQFLTLMIGCGIVLEIFKHVLSPYPGAEKFATAVALGTFAVIFFFALVYQFVGPDRSALRATTFELERDVRTVQAIFLFCILAVIFYYGIAIGKNLKGMVLGYVLYIGTSLVSLAIRAYAGRPFEAAWSVIQPLSFDLSLTIWLISLWSYHPNPAPDPAIPLEGDYEALAARTRRTLVAMRSHLTRTARP